MELRKSRTQLEVSVVGAALAVHQNIVLPLLYEC